MTTAPAEKLAWKLIHKGNKRNLRVYSATVKGLEIFTVREEAELTGAWSVAAWDEKRGAGIDNIYGFKTLNEARGMGQIIAQLHMERLAVVPGEVTAAMISVLQFVAADDPSPCAIVELQSSGRIGMVMESSRPQRLAA